MKNSKILPRGIRNNNPMNVRKSKSKWTGKVEPGTDPLFEQFGQMRWGIRAGLYLLTRYVRDYGLDTVEKIIHRWAPNGDGGNNEAAYVEQVVQGQALHPHVMRNPYWLRKLAAGMCMVESRYPLTDSAFRDAFYQLPHDMRAFWLSTI